MTSTARERLAALEHQALSKNVIGRALSTDLVLHVLLEIAYMVLVGRAQDWVQLVRAEVGVDA